MSPQLTERSLALAANVSCMGELTPTDARSFRRKQRSEYLSGEPVRYGALRLRNTQKADFQISYSLKDYYNNNGSSTKL